MRQTIGLGQATRIERLEIFWPTTGRTQVFEDLAPDRFLRIVEDRDTIDVIELRAVPLGG